MSEEESIPTNENIAIDILDISYPLLSRFRDKCPGTYTHGRNVAALLEAIGTELHLNVPLLRIAGLYHDIGKMMDPKYFSENQEEDDKDPHADLPAYVSYKIITGHVGDTAQILLNDSNIPTDVIRWCVQHHGSTILRYFFVKSNSKNEDHYRYNCSAPCSLEAGLLMICDCLEAKCRSLYQADKLHNVQDIVDGTIDELIADGQLDDVGLPKLSYLRKIKDVLLKELSAIYKSKRVDYDKAKDEIEDGKD